MAKIKRNCDYCKKEYLADSRNLKRGWGLCCTKSCAANKREKSKPGYDPVKVAENNILRAKIQEEKYIRGANKFARSRGFPNYAELENSNALEDGSWDAHGGVTLSICDVCELRSDYCRCGDE